MRIYVTPVAGKTPRAPVPPYGRIPAEGMFVESCPSWRRLEKAGDIKISKSAPSAAKSDPSKTTPKSK